MLPIKITDIKLYLDSLVCIHWINSYVNKIDKMNKVNVFIKNRLKSITSMCDVHAIKFLFCAGNQNPADFISRAYSAKILSKSNYHSGIPTEMITNIEELDIQYITVPNVHTINACVNTAVIYTTVNRDRLLIPEKFSSYGKIYRIYSYVYRWINNLKSRINSSRACEKYSVLSEEEICNKAVNSLIKDDQYYHFPQVLKFLKNKSHRIKDIPPIVTQLNVFMGDDGILYVKSKMKGWGTNNAGYPMLLAKTSTIAKLIIRDTHIRKSHVGVYSVLTEIRKHIYVPHIYSVVKKILRECVVCRRFNNRTISLNQNCFRDFQINPPDIPFRFIFIDHIGPFHVNNLGERTKCYVLIISCLWSRAINLVFCEDLTNRNFIRALQEHIMEHGLPELCWSDAGSQLTSSGRIIEQILGSTEIADFLKELGIKKTSFQNYPKGCNKLGGIIESLVKVVKRVFYGTIGNSVLNVFDFIHLIKHAIHTCNRRPVAYKYNLRDTGLQHEIPFAITPENLVKGRELETINILPTRNDDERSDPSWILSEGTEQQIVKSFDKLSAARRTLHKLYQEEFLPNMMDKGTDVANRYKPVNHRTVGIGDIVLLKEDFVKPCNYAMGRVLEVFRNELGETTSAKIYRGRTGVEVHRHVTSIIPLLSSPDHLHGNLDSEKNVVISEDNSELVENSESLGGRRPSKRSAAKNCNKRNNELYSKSLV